MKMRIFLVVLILALAPACLLAAETAAPVAAAASEVAPAAPAAATTAPVTSAGGTAVPAATATGSTAAGATAPAAVAPLPPPPQMPTAKKLPEPDYTSYLVVKGGWFGSDGDYQGSDFDGSEAWEIAVGTGRTVGFEFGVGAMSNRADNIKVDMIPLLLSLRLQVPIGVVAPNAEIGGGAYFTETTVGNRASTNDTTFGWHAGIGCDLLLGRFLVGAQARYMGISPSVDQVGELTLDRYQGLIRAGVRF